VLLLPNGLQAAEENSGTGFPEEASVGQTTYRVGQPRPRPRLIQAGLPRPPARPLYLPLHASPHKAAPLHYHNYTAKLAAAERGSRD